MDKSGANIDLLFRNGLKDYEVLPPQDVWDNIQPSIEKKSRTFIFLRVAAMTALFISLGIVAYLLTRQPVPSDALASIDISGGLPYREDIVVNTGTNQKVIKQGIQEFYQEAVSEKAPAEIKKAPAFETENVTIPDDSFKLAKEETASVQPEQPEANIYNMQLPELTAEVKKPQNDRWSIAAMASPTFYSNMGAENQDKPAISYSGGFNVAYKINKRLTIQTGVYYASHGQKINGIASFAGFGKYNQTKGYSNFEVATASGPVLTSNPDMFLVDVGSGSRIMTAYTSDFFDPEKSNLSYVSSNIIQNFSYLEMPVMVRYKIIDKSLDINIIGGVSYDVLLSNSVYTRAGGDKIDVGKTRGMNSLALSSSLGMGMEYSLSGKISLNLEPTFRYFLNHVNELASPDVHPYSFGIFSGFSYRF